MKITFTELDNAIKRVEKLLDKLNKSDYETDKNLETAILALLNRLDCHIETENKYGSKYYKIHPSPLAHYCSLMRLVELFGENQ